VNEQEIVQELTRRAWALGCAVYLTPADHVLAGGLRCSGYFDPDPAPPVLAVAWGAGERRLGVLFHEFCHLTQWAESAPVWMADEGAEWSDWLAGKPVRGAKAQIERSRELEADCERRAIRLMREMEAPVDLEAYARSANAYVHFYNLMATERKWFAKGKAPYLMPNVMAAANPTLDRDFSKTPPRLLDALRTCIESES
jgi:hypothetical protein